MPTITERPPCIGVVLAGGLSTRMGRDKAMLDWHGRPLIERQREVLHASGVDEVLVSGHRPDYHGIADKLPGLGPLGGLAAVAEAKQGEAELLVIPVDMPCLQAALLQRLRTEQPQARCLRFADHVLPMRVRLDEQSRALLAELLREHEPRRRAVRVLQQALACADIALGPDEATQLLDCNTETTWNEVSR